MESKRRYETLAWCAVWFLVFIMVPVTMLGQFLSGQVEGALHHVLTIWTGIMPFFVVFIVHHFLLIPLVNTRRPLYIILTLVLMSLFGAYCFSLSHGPDGPPHGWEGAGTELPEVGRYGPPPDRPQSGLPPRPEADKAPLRPDVMNFVMGILIVTADLGLFYFFETLRNKKKVEELQSESISQQLEALRYQINPHFFMNTLNNIHSLVDIDPEKAKESIEEFSKIMRTLLYEGNSPTIPLSHEMDFMKHYISLMRLRYPEDSVHIEHFFPEDCSRASVPPLLMASFVENAFKHGISYEQESFIRVRLDVLDGKILFRCVNSDHSSDYSDSHGLGLDNISRRLTLLYGNDFTLTADTQGKLYEVLLVIPRNPQNISS